MDFRKDIIKHLQAISGKYSMYEVFTDWIKAASLSIENATTIICGGVWEEREKEYISVINRYTNEEQSRFSEMLAMLAMTLEDGEDDVLGGIYMASEMGSKSAGQFFTPFHLSYLTAKVRMEEVVKRYNGEIITLNEPSCGGGGMIIAAAKVLREAGINYQKQLRVIAQDLDWKGCYMTYLQLSLLGIKAKVIQGDSLAIDNDIDPLRVMYTPAAKGCLL